eukprot:TRINITY_DN841_c0_g1_i1.p1 TRINITY_DN841_c0_g1~~TRINITY_DN841_c0_g1_i1.p1  ORF type:complete len:230 (+),score=68.87 TRINITY_DN841_c0_g1_i1:29-718(+)
MSINHTFPACFDVEAIPKVYFLESEVKAHCFSNDVWVSLNGLVFNITNLIIENEGNVLCEPLLKNAGGDISNWFDSNSGNLKTFIHPQTNAVAPFTPDGSFLHCPNEKGLPSEDDFVGVPWWQDYDYIIGILTNDCRKLRIINALTKSEDIIVVPAEETINQICERYLSFNAHCASYTWKWQGEKLDMDKTLDENGVDNVKSYQHISGLIEEEYIPAIFLYYNDDLTVA